MVVIRGENSRQYYFYEREKDMEYVKIETKNGESIYFEIPSKTKDGNREQQVAAHKRIKEVLVCKAESFLDNVAGFADDICQKFKECNASEIEIEFGLSLDVSTGEVVSYIVNGSTNASMVVKLKWKEEKND